MSRVAKSVWGDTPLGQYPNSPGYKERGTSRDAALAIAAKAQTIRGRVLTAFVVAGAAGLTSDEAAAAIGEMDWRRVRPRVSELLKDGLLVETEYRRPNDTSLKAKVMRIAP